MEKVVKAAPLVALAVALGMANWNARTVQAYDYPQVRDARLAAQTAVATALATTIPSPVQPSPSPAAPVATARPAAAPAASQPAGHPDVNWLASEDGRLSVYVGVYNDPTGRTAIPRGYAVLDLAITDVPWYFDGHNPGVFTPLLGEGAGSLLDYWDGGGKLHKFRIVSVRSWQRLAGEPPPVSSAVVAQFQTCRTLDGSVDWIYDAVAA